MTRWKDGNRMRIRRNVCVFRFKTVVKQTSYLCSFKSINTHTKYDIKRPITGADNQEKITIYLQKQYSSETHTS